MACQPRVCPEWLEKPAQQLARMRIELARVLDDELNPVAAGNQQGGTRQAADVFLALQDKFCDATVCFDGPGAGRGKG